MRFSLYRNGPTPWVEVYNQTDRIKPWEPPPLIKSKFAKKILITLALGAGGALVTMSAAGAVYFMVQGAIVLALNSRDYHREARRLEKRGYIALTKKKKGFAIRLLRKANQRLKRIIIEDIRLPVSDSWDGKWRLFIFDIPEKSRTARDLLRKKLKDVGMYNIQRSVFAYPHDCRKELDFLAEHYRMDRFTTYAEVSYSDLDKELRNFFGLKKVKKL